MVQFDLFETSLSDILSAGRYLDFRQKLSESNCSRCTDLQAGRHTIVVDRGNPFAKIALIGEAPGENEDLEGKAFVGRAGQLLDKIMESIGLNTNKDTLILNVVKCRPPENRAPRPSEAQNCLPFLQWQLNSVKPKVIVLLGATAAKYFLPEMKENGMKDLVGTFFDVPAYPFAKFQLLYHPAYLLRDPRKKADMWTHVKALKTHLETNNILGGATYASPDRRF